MSHFFQVTDIDFVLSCCFHKLRHGTYFILSTDFPIRLILRSNYSVPAYICKHSEGKKKVVQIRKVSCGLLVPNHKPERGQRDLSFQPQVYNDYRHCIKCLSPFLERK